MITRVVLEIETVWLKLEHPINILFTTSKLEDVVNVSGWVPSFEVLPLLNMIHCENILLISLTFNKPQLFKNDTFSLKLYIFSNAEDNDVPGEINGISVALNVRPHNNP